MDNGLYNSLREKLLYQEILDLDDEGVRGVLTDLLDRESMMRPLSSYGEYTCPMCEITVSEGDEYCWHCGQKLDWED
jgi:hypothetical protein